MVSVTIPFATETTLTESDSWFTTQASSLVRGLTETGSMPTGISAINLGLDAVVTSKTDSRASAVLTANSRVPSGDKRMGLVCAPSKLTYALSGTWAGDLTAPTAAHRITIAISLLRIMPEPFCCHADRTDQLTV